ncbi:transposase [Candidatus Vondammii sp. HM_W22]|uniref:transposase n=1 Tax=Candidatus Vondammii sp. HM_W22 TaxID=2687299 RepID=UPI001F132DD2|nr:transposase [Candidatus Vondammii sp. HM_W22]
MAGTIKDHLWGILNAIVLEVSNGPAEGLNSRIKMIKIRSRSFRNKELFANAIYLHLGVLGIFRPKVTLISTVHTPQGLQRWLNFHFARLIA